MDEEAAEVEAEVAPLLVCVTINCSIHACCSGVNTGPGVGVPPEGVCRDAIDWRGETLGWQHGAIRADTLARGSKEQ